MITIINWLKQMDESTAKTRARDMAMKGLPGTEGRKIPDADMLGGHSTNPWYNKFKDGTAWKGKKKAKSKPKAKKKG